VTLRLRLTDADRARYGGDEWLDWDPDHLAYSEAVLLQELVGVTPAEYVRSWLGGGTADATKWALWLSLRRAGVEVDWDSFDPDIIGTRVERAGESEGKDPSTPPTTSGPG
jgi:hypothetical protein